MEVWKDIQGYERLYQVSNLGNVKSLFLGKEKILSKGLDEKGYYRVSLSKNNKSKTFKVHRLVLIAFVENEESKSDVNHINGIKTDNTLDNLEWCTKSENKKHAYKTGLVKTYRGEINGNSKISKEIAFKIKYLHKGESQRKIAKIYGIAQTSVSAIQRGITWTHI